MRNQSDFFRSWAIFMREAAKRFPDANLIASALVTRHEAGKTIDAHAHAEGQLSVVLRGTMKIRCHDGWWLAPAGRGIWIPAGIVHTALYSETAEFVLLKIAPDAASRLPVAVRTIAVSSLLREIALHLAKGVDEGELAARLLLQQVEGAEPSSAFFLPSGVDLRLTRLTEHLRNDPKLSLSLDELATMAGGSRRTLSRLFLLETGMTFSRWRDHLRIVTAVDRLVRGSSIAEVAADVGFSSQSSFTTMFTRVIGMSPRRYLRQGKPDEPEHG